MFCVSKDYFETYLPFEKAIILPYFINFINHIKAVVWHMACYSFF